jgi:guanine nucleotide-binding protein alpha-1 subunit
MCLTPLASVQNTLETNLGAASLDPHSTSTISAAPFDEVNHHSGRRPLQEFSINSSNGWKTALEKFRTLRSAPATRTDSITNDSLAAAVDSKKIKDSEETIAEIIASCRDDIKSLWDDNIVAETLVRRKVRLEDGPG